MFVSRRILTVGLVSLLLCHSSAGFAYSSAVPPVTNKTSFDIALLYIQPYSNDLKYATFVSGTQPYFQSWHYQEIKPDYHPAFELGFNYAIPHTSYSAYINWIHLNSNDTSSKQATTNTDISTVEFVGPPYEMSPPVFGIKRVDSKVNFNFDNILLNASKLVTWGSLQTRIFGGIDLLKLNQTITTTFIPFHLIPRFLFKRKMFHNILVRDLT